MTAVEKPDVIGATRRAETIRGGMIGYAAAMEAIGEAFEARDWVALGHTDWDTYCDKEFSEKRLKLTRDQREQAVLAFRGAGMSTRAIASALGVDPKTVRNDLSGGEFSPPAAVVGADGKTYAAIRPAAEDTPVDQPPTPDAPEAAYSEPRTGPADGRPEVDRQDANPGETDEGADLSVADGAATPSAEREPGPTGVSAPAPAIDHSGGRGEEQGQAAAPVPAPGKSFAEVLDEHVPDPNPHANWRAAWLKAIKNAYGPASFAIVDIATNGDDDTFTALIDVRDFFDSLLTKVQAERIRIAKNEEADLPDNVRQFRRPA